MRIRHGAPGEVCCNQPMELDPIGYYYVCYKCGLVSSLKVLVTPEADYMVIRHDDMPQVKSMPRAGYPSDSQRKKNANFENILQQYFGAAPRNTVGMKQYNRVLALLKPLNLGTDRQAYAKIRAFLKQKRISGFYPLIFTLLYDLGGVRPKEAMISHHRIRAEYAAAEHYHQQLCRDRSEKRSMPSAWMLLDFILRFLECPSYYELPILANKTAHKQVAEFLIGFENDILDRRTGIDIHQFKRVNGVWPIWADSQQKPKPEL